MTDDKRAVLDRMVQCELEGRFDEHTTPPAMELALPVDETFDYEQKGFVNACKLLFAHTVDWFAERKIIKNLFRLQYIGLDNLRDVPNSVVVCNHVHMFDCVIVRNAYRRRNIFITGAEFNNRSDFLGFLMRYNGMLPFSSNRKAMAMLNKRIQSILHQPNGHVLVFPEASEWWYYKKPRPFKPGAFHYAVAGHVPIQPMFITFNDTGRCDSDGNPTPDATLHILPAIYPKDDLNHKQNEAYLSEAAFAAMRQVYEDVYGVKLSYSCDCVEQS